MRITLSDKVITKCKCDHFGVTMTAHLSFSVARTINHLWYFSHFQDKPSLCHCASLNDTITLGLQYNIQYIKYNEYMTQPENEQLLEYLNGEF